MRLKSLVEISTDLRFLGSGGDLERLHDKPLVCKVKREK